MALFSVLRLLIFHPFKDAQRRLNVFHPFKGVQRCSRMLKDAQRCPRNKTLHPRRLGLLEEAVHPLLPLLTLPSLAQHLHTHLSLLPTPHSRDACPRLRFAVDRIDQVTHKMHSPGSASSCGEEHKQHLLDELSPLRLVLDHSFLALHDAVYEANAIGVRRSDPLRNHHDTPRSDSLQCRTLALRTANALQHEGRHDRGDNAQTHFREEEPRGGKRHNVLYRGGQTHASADAPTFHKGHRGNAELVAATEHCAQLHGICLNFIMIHSTVREGLQDAHFAVSFIHDRSAPAQK